MTANSGEMFRRILKMSRYSLSPPGLVVYSTFGVVGVFLDFGLEVIYMFLEVDVMGRLFL